LRLFLERADNHLRGLGHRGVVVADRPGGRQRDDDRFLATCIDTLREGTRFVQFERVALVITTPSHLHRLMQPADVVTGCATSSVSGEGGAAPQIFGSVVPISRRELGRIGGVGLKIQPDHRYVNLYHWLLGDDYLVRYPVGHPLPDQTHPYARSPEDF
jgi:hypothetical protein